MRVGNRGYKAVSAETKVSIKKILWRHARSNIQFPNSRSSSVHDEVQREFYAHSTRTDAYFSHIHAYFTHVRESFTRQARRFHAKRWCFDSKFTCFDASALAFHGLSFCSARTFPPLLPHHTAPRISDP